MDLVIARSEGIVSIDNQPLVVDTSPLATTIELIAYDCTVGSGNVEYNDRLRVLEPFGDLTPYTSFVNAWMTAAAAIVAMPLTLTQAKRVKIGLVDGIFNSKRQLPIQTQNHSWDTTDQSMIGMQAAVAASNIEGQVNASVNASIAGLQSSSSTGQTVGVAVSGEAHATGTVSGTYVTTVSFGGGGTYSLQSITAVAGVAGSASVTQQPQYQTNTSTSMPPIGIVGPSISWPALDTPSPVTLSMSNMRALINSIQQRRSSLQATRLSKTNAINALTAITGITGVIAYDATTGWPF